MSSFITKGIVVIKSGKLLFSHPEGTHDDRFWALALAAYVAETAPPSISKPLARTI